MCFDSRILRGISADEEPIGRKGGHIETEQRQFPLVGLRLMANNSAYPHHVTTPQQTRQIGVPFNSTLNSTFQTNNSNRWVNSNNNSSNNNDNNNDNDNDWHHLTKSNEHREVKMVARDFLSTVRPYYLNVHSNRWTCLPVYPPHLFSSSSSSFQQPTPIPVPSSSPYLLHVMQTSPRHVTVCPSLTPEGESAFSDRSSMTSSKVHDDGLQGHWDQSSMNDSARESTAFPGEDDDCGPPTTWPLHDDGPPVPRPLRTSTASIGSGYDDKKANGEISYDDWDRYGIRRESDLRPDAVSVDMELCSVASNCDPDFGDVGPEDPEHRPIDGSEEKPKSGQEGLSETELLCFLRLLEKRDSGCSVRYTVNQLVTCIPETDVMENEKHITAAMSCVEKESYGRLLRLAPKATKTQVVHAMKLLPFILKSVGETALSTTPVPTTPTTSSSGDENRAKVRLRRRSRSRSRSSSFSRRRRRRRRRFGENSWSSPERRRRRRVRSSGRYSPVGKHRSTVPEQRLRSGRGSGDFTWKREQRRQGDRYGRSRRWEDGREERRSRREFPRASHRLTKTTDERTAEIRTMGNWKRRRESDAHLLSRKRRGKSTETTSESGCVGESKKKEEEEDIRLSPGPRLQRRNNVTKTDMTTIRNSEDVSSLLPDIGPTTSVASIERHNHHHHHHHGSERISGGTDDSLRPGARAGLLPTPGTTAYKAVMERAAISRLRNLSQQRRIRAVLNRVII